MSTDYFKSSKENCSSVVCSVNSDMTASPIKPITGWGWAYPQAHTCYFRRKRKNSCQCGRSERGNMHGKQKGILITLAVSKQDAFFVRFRAIRL